MRDEEIIELYWNRSEDALAQTADKYGHFLTGISYRILYNAEDTEECVNDTYLHAWNSMPPHKPSKLQVFLGAIVRNLSLDCYREKHAKKRVPTQMVTLLSELEEVVPTASTVEKEYENKEIAAYISNFLKEQPLEKRQLFLRRYWYCDEIKKLATDFGYSESKVKSSLFHMRNKLREYLEQRGVVV